MKDKSEVFMKFLKWTFIISLIVSISAGLFFQTEHAHFWWEKVPVFDAIFGFLGCILLMIGSKALGRHWLQKKEDYYND